MENSVGRKVAKKQEAKQEIKQKAIRFTKVVSLVGIRHATDERNSNIRRSIWVLWLFFGFGFAFYQIGSRVDDYFKYQSRIENKILINTSLPFPQVTICNENPIMPEKAKEKGITEFMANITQKLTELENMSVDHNMTLKELWKIVEDFHNKTRNWEELSRELSQTQNETIVMVSFNDEENLDLVEEVITDLGYCYAFGTSGKRLTAQKEGAMNGLTVVLNANRQAFPFNSREKPGYKILIHDPNETPLLKEAGFSLELGMITRVEISMKNVSLLGHPYDNCNREKNDAYRTVQCHAENDYKAFMKRCHCADLHMKAASLLLGGSNETFNGTFNDITDGMFNGTFNGTVCSLAQIINCTQIAESLSRTNANFQVPTFTGPKCEPECNSQTYTSIITRSSFPLLMNEVSKVPGEAQVQNRFRVHIYYPHMSYIEAQSYPAITGLDLVCDISGALSLLLGATLLTVYEAGEFLFLFFKDYAQFRWRK